MDWEIRKPYSNLFLRHHEGGFTSLLSHLSFDFEHCISPIQYDLLLKAKEEWPLNRLIMYIVSWFVNGIYSQIMLCVNFIYLLQFYPTSRNSQQWKTVMVPPGSQQPLEG